MAGNKQYRVFALTLINKSLQLIGGLQSKRFKVGSIKPLPSDIAIVSRKVDIKSARDIVRVKCCDREKFSLTVFRVAWSKDRRQAANAPLVAGAIRRHTLGPGHS